jgi:hypothetical protein
VGLWQLSPCILRYLSLPKHSLFQLSPVLLKTAHLVHTHSSTRERGKGDVGKTGGCERESDRDVVQNKSMFFRTRERESTRETDRDEKEGYSTKQQGHRILRTEGRKRN